MVRLTKCLRTPVLLAAILALGLLQPTAEANSGPPRRVGDTGGPLLPGKSDQVHVLGESLRFDLSPDLSQATVTARYTLANRGPALQQQPFIFVVQDVRGERVHITASWQGEPVPIRMEWGPFAAGELAEMAEAWTTADVWMDPVAGEPYEDQFYGSGPVLRYFRFALDLSADAQGELVVTYDHIAGSDRTRYAYPVYHYHYLLLPARGWASFGPLEIRVAAPGRSRYYFASNLDFRREGHEYVAEYPGLPDVNLSFAVMNRSALFLGTRATPYFWMGFVLVLALSAAVGAGLGRLAGQIPREGLATGVGVLVGVVPGGLLIGALAVGLSLVLPVLREQPGAPLHAIGHAMAGTVLSAVVAGRTARRTAQRHRSGAGAA